MMAPAIRTSLLGVLSLPGFLCAGEPLPAEEKARAVLGEAQALLKAERVEAAAARAEEAVRLSPSLVDARIVLGHVYFKRFGDYRKSRDHYEVVARREPDNWKVLQPLMWASWNLKDSSAAGRYETKFRDLWKAGKDPDLKALKVVVFDRFDTLEGEVSSARALDPAASPQILYNFQVATDGRRERAMALLKLKGADGRPAHPLVEYLGPGDKPRQFRDFGAAPPAYPAIRAAIEGVLVGTTPKAMEANRKEWQEFEGVWKDGGYILNKAAEVADSGRPERAAGPVPAEVDAILKALRDDKAKALTLAQERMKAKKTYRDADTHVYAAAAKVAEAHGDKESARRFWLYALLCHRASEEAFRALVRLHKELKEEVKRRRIPKPVVVAPAAKGDAIEVRVDKRLSKEAAQAWGGYGATRAIYRGKKLYERNFPGAKEYRHGFEEEVRAFEFALSTWRRLKVESGGQIADKGLDALNDLACHGMLEPYLFFEEYEGELDKAEFDADPGFVERLVAYFRTHMVQ